jgi:hypothetical protein
MKYKVGDIEFEIPKCPDPTKARNYGLPIEEQYWRREGFPEDWEFMSAGDRWDFIAEDYRRKEEGFFFWNEGELTYITGDHYFHLEWWNGGIDDNDGYFGFRIADMEDFYFWEYCKQDPNCYGYMAVEGRRGGKTERGLSKGYNLTTLGANRRMFIQSFTESDAKERLFIDTVVRSWRHIPSVLKPKDEGIKEPKKRLRFISRAGLRKDSASKSLDSSIQFVAAKDSSLQGKKVYFVFPDEPASWDKIDLIKWWGITKKAMELGGKVRGKAILPATLENMNPIGGAAFWKLWLQSNFNKRDENGRTESGLYRLFRPADENFELFINKYGKCDKEKARRFILNERATKTDESLINLIRQHPLSEEEAFGAISSSFWEEDVSAFLEEIKKNIIEADFYGERKMVVATGDDTSLIETSDPNCYVEVFEDVQPNVQYCVGFDGSGSDNETGDEGGSDVAFVVMKKFESPRNNNYTDVANFTYRPKKMETVYNILFNLCKHYNKYGRLEILGETNAGQGAAVKSFFANRGGENMMAKQPKNIGFNKTKKTDKYWIYRTEDVIEVQKTLAHIFVRVYGMNMRSLRLVESLLRLGKGNEDLGDAWLMAILLMGDVTAEAKTYVPLPQRRKVRKLERSNGKLQYIWQEI